MPPMGGKSKAKARDGRQSPSRNTTPSSNISIPISIAGPLTTVYLEIPTEYLTIPTPTNYDDILERHGGGGGIPDPKLLEIMANDLNVLSQLADTRGQACDGAMREISKRRKERREEERAREQANREAEEKESLKRAAEDEEEARGRKGAKVKKRKERSNVREERPLTHGAHGLARQDGSDLPAKASTSSMSSQKPPVDTSTPRKQRKLDAMSGSSSSLSPASRGQSPRDVAAPMQETMIKSASASPSSSSLDSRQPPPAPSIAQYQTFGPDPLTFDDPTVYHIREVTDDMTDEEKQEIYCVAQFPHDDLGHLIAGTPPDKDFSNAKPTNQVNANTFATYIEPYLRPLTEEDMAFLKERGDRTTPFVMPHRGKRFYTEVWAEEDGHISLDSGQQPAEKQLPPNQARGGLEQMDDERAETDQISSGPLVSRLLSAMRVEHRPSSTEDKDKPNGFVNGVGEASTNGFASSAPTSSDNPPDDNKAMSLPPATFMPESSLQSWKTPTTKLDHHQVEERLKVELRHIGFLNQDSEPDYDAHNDDEIAERLRTLQAELKRVSVLNGARKARVLELANERMAYQEYTTILEDLDGQVQQVYLKRTRTLGKSKKNTKRPGG
ncbi:Transcriptional regulator, partial [Sticta canariensis]|nr:Transcriptional regulator [Sticta canariensis]